MHKRIRIFAKYKYIKCLEFNPISRPSIKKIKKIAYNAMKKYKNSLQMVKIMYP